MLSSFLSYLGPIAFNIKSIGLLTPFSSCTDVRTCGALTVGISKTVMSFRTDTIFLRATNKADEFDPNRFIDERLHKYLTPNPFIFLPFNAGPRICLGQQVSKQCILLLILKKEIKIRRPKNQSIYSLHITKRHSC